MDGDRSPFCLSDDCLDRLSTSDVIFIDVPAAPPSLVDHDYSRLGGESSVGVGSWVWWLWARSWPSALVFAVMPVLLWLGHILLYNADNNRDVEKRKRDRNNGIERLYVIKIFDSLCG